MVLLSMDSPGGDISKGEVQNMEAARLVMSDATFAEVTALFVDTLKKMQTAKAMQMHANGRPVQSDLPEDRGLPLESFAIGASTHKH